MFVIEEDEGFLGVVSALQPRAAGNGQFGDGDLSGQENGQKDPPFRNNTHDGNRPSGRKHQALAHQKFGMTPFDQQQNTHNSHLQNPLAHVDQKIEERESLRHSTHRSQRSDRANNVMGSGGAGQGGNANHPGSNPGQTGQPMQNTVSDRFGQTDYNMSDNNDRQGVDHPYNEQQQEMAQQ